MQKNMWKARVLPGKLDEYIRRHDEIWPEMVDALKRAEISNYTIWNHGDELIGYYECPNLERSRHIEAESKVMRLWDKSMEGIMEMEREADSGKIKTYRGVFDLP